MSDTPRTHARELADVGVALSDRLDNMTEHARELEREADSLRREVSAARLVLENILARIDDDEWIPSEYVQQARAALMAAPTNAAPHAERSSGTEDSAEHRAPAAVAAPQPSAKQDTSPQVSHTGSGADIPQHTPQQKCASCGYVKPPAAILAEWLRKERERDLWVLTLIDEVSALRRGIPISYDAGADPLPKLIVSTRTREQCEE